VIPAAVQIAIVLDVTSNGVTESLFQPMGSGTVVSADGVILTNWHVVNMAAHRATFDELVAQAAVQGQRFTYHLDEEMLLILTSDGVTPPEPQYVAEIAATDPTLDLAVLQIVGDESFGPLDPASLDLPFVPLGNSDSIGLGEPVDIFGYPGIAGGVLTYTEGVVSGFLSEGQVGRAWINTDATMSGGSSGGTAINREGALIGVPTQGSTIDCRPGDVNLDGRVDARDVGCIPVGGSIGQLRPVNLAYDLLAQVGTKLPSVQDDQEGSIGAEIAESPEPSSSLPASTYLPSTLPVSNASCFFLEVQGEYRYTEVVSFLEAAGANSEEINAFGWLDGAYFNFRCSDPPGGGADFLEVVLHRFASAEGARAAAPYWQIGYVPSNTNEVYICDSSGAFVVCTDGTSPTTLPSTDARALLEQMMAAVA
jgi:S1-C subfamily serine protease